MSLQDNDRFLVGCAYRSPNNSEEENGHLIEELINACQKNYSHVLIAGDFNYPEIGWTSSSTAFDSNHKASKFLERIKDCYLYQHVTEPTHHRENQHPNILDLVFTNEENMIQSILMKSPLGKSHHSGLSFIFQCYQIDGSTSQMRPLYDKGNYDEIRNDLQGVDWNTELKGKNTEDTFAYLMTKLEDEVKKHIPMSRPRMGHKTKALWMSSNALTKTRCAVPNLIQSNGTLTENDTDKVEELNKYFKSVFTNEDLAIIPAFENRSEDDSLEDIEINETIVLKQLENLKVNKSPGPDCLHPRLLKELSSELKGPLTILFTRSLGEGVLPRVWKDANITPIHKKGKKEICGNYRPVSLTSVICKVLERIIRDQAVKYLKQFLTSCQHEFMEGRSCVTQLLDTIDSWSKVLDEGSSLDAVYLDFAKAFDTVPHERLLVKLKGYGIKGKVLEWIRHFLSGRRQRVVVNGHCSSWDSPRKCHGSPPIHMLCK
eukprot:Seg2436.1 transcript_id=Seg2436.1/GoldUCD/mRNA.D3Y31 product="LINE-1 reverse transcriptase" protein_id=Seg2436.1/GoldUCD/D3Y31